MCGDSVGGDGGEVVVESCSSCGNVPVVLVEVTGVLQNALCWPCGDEQGLRIQRLNIDLGVVEGRVIFLRRPFADLRLMRSKWLWRW